MRHDYRWRRARTARARGRKPRAFGIAEIRLALFGGIAAGLSVSAAPRMSPSTISAYFRRPAEPAAARHFTLCKWGGGVDCVVDGDTFWMAGEKIRVADIDAPEIHPPRCAEEAALGDRATLRFQQLLDAGPVTLQPGDRDVDRYGRKLRIVTRGGRSLGDMLVGEGLARHWAGRREPWCGTI